MIADLEGHFARVVHDGQLMELNLGMASVPLEQTEDVRAWLERDHAAPHQGREIVWLLEGNVGCKWHLSRWSRHSRTAVTHLFDDGAVWGAGDRQSLWGEPRSTRRPLVRFGRPVGGRDHAQNWPGRQVETSLPVPPTDSLIPGESPLPITPRRKLAATALRNLHQEHSIVAARAINSAMETADIISQVGYPVVKEFIRKHVARVIPAHVIGPFWRELGLAALRGRTWRVAHEFRYSTDLLVNVGCGPYGKPGWVNLDADLRAHVNRRLDPYPALTARYDCRRRLPFPDGSVKGVFTEHFLEHLHYEEELPTFLRETHRVLQPGGILRIVVPDAEKYVLAYSQGWGALARLRSVDHYRSKMEVVNDVFREAGLHKFAYDYETLEVALMSARFSTVARQQFGTSLLNELAIDLKHRQAESLYVEAVK